MSSMFAELAYPFPMGTEAVPFGDWLRAELERRGMDPADLAARLGVPAGTVSRWLNNRRRPESPYCERIAHVLGIAPIVVLFRAGRIATLPQPMEQYELEREIREFRQSEYHQHRRLERIEALAGAGEVAIRFYGRVPADALRWIQAEEGGEMRGVPQRWLGTRAPAEFFAIQASGDCLLTRGITDGTYVFAEWLHGRMPKNGSIVIVRLESEFSLKVWHRDGDWIELRDGDDHLVWRGSIAENIEAVGLYITHWREP